MVSEKSMKKIHARTRKWCVAILLMATAASAQTAGAPTTAAQVLARARDVMGFGKLSGGVVHLRWITSQEHPYESDRTYAPYLAQMTSGETWFDPESGVERNVSQTMYPGSGPTKPATSIGDNTRRYAIRENAAPVAVPLSHDVRNLNVWLVVADWSKAQDVSIAGHAVYRDYPRVVLKRMVDGREQKLFLDEKTGYPVKLEYVEPHYLWGQQVIEDNFSNWQQFGPILDSDSTFRIPDGEVETTKTTGDVEIVTRDAAPSLELPSAPAFSSDPTPLFLQPLPPKTIDVSAKTKILSNPGYNETVTLAGDEVYVFDATQGDERARQDHQLIKTLYPNAKKINVVVTDLAWPHVAGMRYWVANGATIISHKAAEPFLRQVLERRWTLKPDSYEKVRTKAKFKFIGIDKPTDFADGKIKIFPIDGIGSEVALAAFIADDRFLWGSDYIQTLSAPTSYANEVIAAAKHAGVEPERAAAEHLPLNTWEKIIAAQAVK